MNKSILLVLALAFAVTASAQNGNESRRERMNNISLAEINNRMASRLAKQMKLDDETEQKFTALYLDYQNARHNAVNPRGGDQEGAEQSTNFDRLSDEEATELIQKNFDRQEKQLAVDREYLPKFLEIITPAQAAQVFIVRGNNRQGGQRNGNGGGNRGNGPRGGGFGGGGFGGGFGGF